MEKFYESQIRKLIALIRDRSPDADAQLQFCIEWGGGPLGAAALVAQAWLQDRAGLMQQPDSMPWDPVEPSPSTSAPEPLGRTSASKPTSLPSIQEYDGRSIQADVIAPSSTPIEKTAPEPPKRKASPDWVKAALQRK